MTQKLWVNFFVTSIGATGSDGIIPADKLQSVMDRHNGGEAYHCAFDLCDDELKLAEDTGKLNDKGKKVFVYHTQSKELLEKFHQTFNEYEGTARPAFGRIWFDFDSKDGGIQAQIDARRFVEFLQVPCFIAYSGSKGFHIGVPLNYFDLAIDKNLPSKLHALAKHLKKTYPTIDTTVYNANRKFRALGSRHPKTGLYKIFLHSLHWNLDEIREFAKNPGALTMPPCGGEDPATHLVALCIDAVQSATAKGNTRTASLSDDSLSQDEWRKYHQPRGEAALEQCGFLAHAKANPATIDEPQWYALASIVGRFENGRAQFHALSKGHPGYSAGACDDKLEQSLQASGPRTCLGIDSVWGGCASCPLLGKIKSPIAIMEADVIPTEATGFYDLIAPETPGGKIKRVANYNDLLRAFDRDTNYFRDTKADRTYAWDGTHYNAITAADIKIFCESHFDPRPKRNMRSEFLDKVLANNSQTQEFIERLFYKSIQGKLNLKNGVLDIESGVLSPHSSELGFRYVLPYSYDETTTCPNFDKFLDEVTLSRPSLKQTLLEFMGYCLWPNYDDHCFLWLAGGGRNGKSTYMETLQSLVGADNCTSVLLDQFEKLNYVEMMNHKLVNISEESDSKKIPSEILSILKTLSAGGNVMVDQKYAQPYSMRATAKLIFAANSPPTLGEAQDAIKARMIVVPFDLRLEDSETGESNVRADLTSELVAELPGILNVVLRSLRGWLLRKPRKIHRGADSRAALNQIVRDSDLVESWMQDNIEFKAGAATPLSELFADFLKHASQDTATTYYTEMGFARKLRTKLGIRAEFIRTRVVGQRTQLVQGITLTQTSEF